MRPPSQSRSLLRQPLDAVLGTPAGVRVLRVLTLHRGALTPPDIARRAGLTPEAVRRTLERFVPLGIVKGEGGLRPSYSANMDYPMVAALATSFDAEAERIDVLFKVIRTTAQQSRPQPLAVWLYGSVSRDADKPDSDVDIAVIGEHKYVGRQAERMRDALDSYSMKYLIQPSVITLTPEAITGMIARNDEFWRNISGDAAVIFGSTPQEVAGAANRPNSKD
jgi:predicted nucleotidyltransferase